MPLRPLTRRARFHPEIEHRGSLCFLSPANSSPNRNRRPTKSKSPASARALQLPDYHFPDYPITWAASFAPPSPGA
jgi:hypothetical protein